MLSTLSRSYNLITRELIMRAIQTNSLTAVIDNNTIGVRVDGDENITTSVNGGERVKLSSTKVKEISGTILKDGRIFLLYRRSYTISNCVKCSILRIIDGTLVKDVVDGTIHIDSGCQQPYLMIPVASAVSDYVNVYYRSMQDLCVHKVIFHIKRKNINVAANRSTVIDFPVWDFEVRGTTEHQYITYTPMVDNYPTEGPKNSKRVREVHYAV